VLRDGEAPLRQAVGACQVKCCRLTKGGRWQTDVKKSALYGLGLDVSAVRLAAMAIGFAPAGRDVRIARIWGTCGLVVIGALAAIASSANWAWSGPGWVKIAQPIRATSAT
jgi:hypothetical protein